MTWGAGNEIVRVRILCEFGIFRKPLL
jgi:hypothetical protein